MTRMIERWFPCAEVSANSNAGWGSGNTEIKVFPWFAKRPTAQAKAAVLCSLLPWPDDEDEQKRLQEIVKRAMQGRYEGWGAAAQAIVNGLPGPIQVLDPFAGRGMIPLEASRLGIGSTAIDYSPTAVLAAHLLTDFPFRAWSNEPEIEFRQTRLSGAPEQEELTPLGDGSRLVADVATVLNEVGRRYFDSMRDFYPAHDDAQPWGYVWAVSLPCQECGNRFPLVGSYLLRPASFKKGRGRAADLNDPGQSFYVEADPVSGEWSVVIHEGGPRRNPIRQVAGGKSRYDSSGKVAVCPFCEHTHAKDIHVRLAAKGEGRDELLLAADLHPQFGKVYREVTAEERRAVARASTALAQEPSFTPVLPARPEESIPEGNTWTVQASVYGAQSYGDLMNDRQTLGFVRLSRSISSVAVDLRAMGCSEEYVRALTGYCAAVLARKIRRSTRGATLDPRLSKVNDIFATESSLNFSYDYFEAGIGEGPGTWQSVASSTLSALKAVVPPTGHGSPSVVMRGDATRLHFANHSFSAVVTDPPYAAMIDYSDASDLFFVWLKRALWNTWPELGVTAHPSGVQEKDREVIVKKGGTKNRDHRNQDHYNGLIAESFTQAKRVVANDGVVTIVFGHGDHAVWRQLLTSIQEAGLVLTGSWPARTEQGGKVGFSNIVTTLTMACRPAEANRDEGLKAQVQAEIKAAVKERISQWDQWGLAPTDMLMAAAGPAMEVVGRYSRVVDITGEPLDPMGYPVEPAAVARSQSRGQERPVTGYLEWARQAVQEYASIEIDHHPLDTFDSRTRFALWWVQLFRKNVTADSELRWQVLAADLDERQVSGVIVRTKKGARFADSGSTARSVDEESPVIDVAFAAAAAWPEGMDSVGAVLASAGREEDPYLWATVRFLSERLPASDPDADAWTRILRNRPGVIAAARGIAREATTQQESLDFSGGTGV